MDVDGIDRVIIDQLRVDGRRSFAIIARNVGLSEASVRARYRRLARAGIVQVVGMADAQRLGQVEVHLAIRVRGVPLSAVARQLAAIPEVKYVASATGSTDLIVDLRADDIDALAHLLGHDVRRIAGVSDVKAMMVLDVVTDTYLWAGFREEKVPESVARARAWRQVPRL